MLGYLVAADELIGQLADRGIDAARVVVPCSSGGTAAGLVLGKSMLGWISAGRIAADEHVVFVHTGGMPGLFGYAPDAIVNLA